MVGQLHLSHAACAKGLGEGVVSENAVRGAGPVRIDGAMGLPVGRRVGLVCILT
jgi:hypothetical protein